MDIEDAKQEDSKQVCREYTRFLYTQPGNTEQEIQAAFRKARRKFRIQPPKYKIISAMAEIEEKPPLWLELFAVIKVGRSMSGYYVVSISLPPSNEEQESCEWDCVFCPDIEKHGYEKDGEIVKIQMTRSYHQTEDTVARAVEVDWDTVKQVILRLSMATKAKHSCQKIAVRILGGTFSPQSDTTISAVKKKQKRKKAFQEKFVTEVFYACNIFNQGFNQGFNSGEFNYGEQRKMLSLSEEQWINENDMSVVKIVEMSIETRPDTLLDPYELLRLRELGITLVEIGFQHDDDQLLKIVKRGHGVWESQQAILYCKMIGLKVQLFVMFDLPGGSCHGGHDGHDVNYVYYKDRLCTENLMSNPLLQADNYKLYITVNADGTPGLTKMLADKTWNPYSDLYRGELIIKNVAYFLSKLRRDKRCQRVHRDFSDKEFTHGDAGYKSKNIRSNFRQKVSQYMKENGMECIDIRTRQTRQQHLYKEPNTYITVTQHRASYGTEFFIECIDDQDNLYGFVRLRKNDKPANENHRNVHERLKAVFPHLFTGNVFLIRALKVHGTARKIGDSEFILHMSQHRGIGYRLMDKAEEIAARTGNAKMVVISGIGARKYFELKHGYVLEGNYMVKYLDALENAECVVFVIALAFAAALFISTFT